VSRITPIKQFPILLKLIAPILKEFPNMNIEIFGAGGYASVRDCKHALQPIKNRVRFWGHQWQVGAAYAECDYVLSGLPEKEALGLNLLEAQCCNIPVIAVKAPPFTETVNDQVSGYLYTDPRLDQGADFRRVLQKINSRETPKLKPADSPHLTQFTMDSFQKTLQDIVKQIDINCHNFKGNK
jgi:glycosyltransferase involved in cell wall biosynthesis